jgi:thioredoxin
MNRLILSFTLIIFAFAIISCNSKSEKNGDNNTVAQTAVDSTKTDTTTANASGPVVMDFYATWCGPCKMLAPILEKMEKKYAGKINFQRIDIDQNQELASQYQVEAVPTLIFKSRSGQVTTSVGLLTEQELDSKLQQLISQQ